MKRVVSHRLSFFWLGLAVIFLHSFTSVTGAELTVESPAGADELYLGNTLVIKATGSQAVSVLAEIANGNAHQKLRLYLQGTEIPRVSSSITLPEKTAQLVAARDAAVTSATSDPAAKATAEKALLEGAEVFLNIRVQRFPEEVKSREAWDAVFQSIKGLPAAFEVALGVGERSPVLVSRYEKGRDAKAKSGEASESEVLPGAAAVLFRASNHIPAGIITGILVGVGCIFFLYFNSKMLRDNGSPDNPFSLGRSQMAFWGIVVLSCFVGDLVACQTLEYIPAQVLVLLGISTTTGLAAQIMDNDAKPAKKSDRTWPLSFFDDICVGDQGASFHRVQLVLWTIVLGGYFILSVAQRMSMPVFPDTLLILMGISNGTYLGFKPQENKAQVPSNSGAADGSLAVTGLALRDTTLEANVSNGLPPYAWKIEGAGSVGIVETSGKLEAAGSLKLVINKPYPGGTVKLEVTDAAKNSATTSLEVKAG